MRKSFRESYLEYRSIASVTVGESRARRSAGAPALMTSASLR